MEDVYKLFVRKDATPNRIDGVLYQASNTTIATPNRIYKAILRQGHRIWYCKCDTQTELKKGVKARNHLPLPLFCYVFTS